MRAITVSPGIAHSARLEEIPEPSPGDGAVLVRTWALGVCGTDREILAGVYGSAPPGEQRLVLGHESLGEVMAGAKAFGACPRRPRRRHRAPARSGAVPGLRRRASGTCAATGATPSAASRSGTASAPSASASSRNSPSRSTRIWAFWACCSSPPALSPRPGIIPSASAAARAPGSRGRLLVTGAGPIGLLAALMGMQRDLDVHVLDHNKDGPKPALVRDLGAHLSHRRGRASSGSHPTS